MTQKVLKKPTLVLMAGLPGVGKTTLAFALGQKLGWAVLEKDLLKELFLAVPSFDEDRAGWEAYEYSLHVTEQFLVNYQLSVILDTSLLYPFILERAEKLVACSGAQLKVILCDVDEDTRQERLHTRAKRMSQARAHLVSWDKAKQFDQIDPSLYKKIRTKPPLTKSIGEAVTYVMGQEQEVSGSQNISVWFNNFRYLLSNLFLLSPTVSSSWNLPATCFSSFGYHTIGAYANVPLPYPIQRLTS